MVEHLAALISVAAPQWRAEMVAVRDYVHWLEAALRSSQDAPTRDTP